jgi:hypothetical protein
MGWSYVSSSASSCRSLSSSSLSCWRSLQIQAAKPAVAIVTVTTSGSQYPNADLPGRACRRRAVSYRSMAFKVTSIFVSLYHMKDVASASKLSPQFFRPCFGRRSRPKDAASGLSLAAVQLRLPNRLCNASTSNCPLLLLLLYNNNRNEGLRIV